MKPTKAWVLVISLQVLILLGQWVGLPAIPHASAQIPDSGAQINSVIEELKAANAKLDHISDALDSGKLQVKAVLPDDKSGSQRAN
jgi:hypothetical protein